MCGPLPHQPPDVTPSLSAEWHQHPLRACTLGTRRGAASTGPHTPSWGTALPSSSPRLPGKGQQLSQDTAARALQKAKQTAAERAGRSSDSGGQREAEPSTGMRARAASLPMMGTPLSTHPSSPRLQFPAPNPTPSTEEAAQRPAGQRGDTGLRAAARHFICNTGLSRAGGESDTKQVRQGTQKELGNTGRDRKTTAGVGAGGGGSSWGTVGPAALT